MNCCVSFDGVEFVRNKNGLVIGYLLFLTFSTVGVISSTFSCFTLLSFLRSDNEAYPIALGSYSTVFISDPVEL